MKKIFSLFVLALCCTMSFAASITASDVNFGEVSIKGKDSVQGETTLPISWAGLPLYSQVEVEVVNQPATDCAFSVDGAASTYIWTGSGEDYDPFVYSYDCALSYTAQAVGNYACQIHIYVYDPDNTTDYVIIAEKTINVTLTVTGDAVVAKTMPFERIESTSGLHAGDTVVFVCESAGAIGGPLNGTFLPAVTENVSIDATHGTAQVPETAQLFVLSQYSGNWQLTATGIDKRLHLDVSGKGAFTYADTQAGTILANWGIEIVDGEAIVSRPDEEQTFPVWFNGDRFKPYKNTGSFSEIALYKKTGAAEEIQSSLAIEPATIVFADTEMGDEAESTVHYTAENLTDDIIWEITGADAAHFEVSDSGDRNQGTVTIRYKGTKTGTGAVSANLTYLTQNAQLDLMDGTFPISLTLIPNTVKLTGLAFAGAPATIDQHQTIDMSQYLVFTPNDAADKSVTWATDHDYQGTIDADGKLYAKQVTGDIVVTVTSVRVPSVSATHTLTITVPTITDFTLSDSETTLYIGGKDTLGITAFVPDYASATATYTSSNADIAGVNKNGVITAKALGDAEIIATIGTVEKKCIVHVIATPVASVAFEPAEIEMTLGNKKQLTAIVLPAQAAADHAVTYTSDNEAIVSVSASGLAEAKAEGTAVITATADGKSSELTIHVVAPILFEKLTDPAVLKEKDTIIIAGKGSISETAYEVVAGEQTAKILTPLTDNITITDQAAGADEALRLVVGTLKNKEGYTLQPVGSTRVLAENGNDFSLENTTSTKNMTWLFVADEKGVYIQNAGNSNAYIKYLPANHAIKPYKATTAGADLLYVYIRPYIAPAAESISLSKSELMMHIGDPDATLKATVLPSEASQEVVWTSSNEDVATVVNGKIHAVAEGSAIITAKVASDETLTATCEVTVSEWKVESIELDAMEDSLKVGETLRINATVLPSEHHWDVDFYTSDETIATVTIGGLVTGIAPGDAVITAKAGDKEAQITIHVIPVPVPVEMGEISIADFLAAKDTFNIYTLTGVVSNIKMDKDGILYNDYGNFDLTDSTGTIFIYGLLTADSVAQQFLEMDIAEGDTLTLKGSYSEFKGRAEIENAIFVALRKYIEPEGIGEVMADEKAIKVLRDGQVMIIRKDEVFTIKGEKVSGLKD